MRLVLLWSGAGAGPRGQGLGAFDGARGSSQVALNPQKRHLLRALHLKKVRSTEAVLELSVGRSADERDFHARARLLIEELACLKLRVVSK